MIEAAGKDPSGEISRPPGAPEEVEALAAPLLARAISRAHRVRIKLHTCVEALRQRASSPAVGIVGAYNTSNLGDLAMGAVLRGLARAEGLGSGVVSYANLGWFPEPRAAVLGGGGVITTHPSSSFARFVRRWGELADRTALVGVSGELQPDECPDEVLEFLSRVPVWSARSRHERDGFAAATGRTDIAVQPDITWAAPGVLELDLPERDAEKRVLGLNVTPVLMGCSGGRFRPGAVPSDWYRRHLPEEAAVYSSLGPGYVAAVREVVRGYRSRGWHVRCIPLALEDELFARAVFDAREVELAPYSLDVAAAIRRAAGCSRFVATRFHSHIFAMLAGVPVLSIAYSPKCEYLWRELGLPGGAQVRLIELAREARAAAGKLIDSEPAALDDDARDELRRESEEACLRGLRSVAVQADAG